MSSKPDFHAALHQPGLLAFAHRGAGEVAPENTLAAFRAAVDLGFRVLETDIQASLDGTCYAFHDDDLYRLTGDKRTIAQLHDHEIDRLRIAGKHPIPTLAELFETFPETLFNLDAKSKTTCLPLAELILATGRKTQVCIGSFSDARIASVLKILGPKTCHSTGMRNSALFYFAARLGVKPHLTANCLQLPTHHYGISLITAKTVAAAQKTGLKTHIWTINDPASIHHLIALGVDGIMTDDCTLLKVELIKSGLWQA